MRVNPAASPPAEPPDVRSSLPWRELSIGLDEAAAKGLPIVCLAEPPWSTGAQRLALVLGREDETRRMMEDAFVPVWLDPVTRPDVAARLRWASMALTGTIGPPLLVFLTGRGVPFLAYGNLWPEGRAPYPSLRSLLDSVSGLYGQRRRAFEIEADHVQARAASGGPKPPAGVWPAIHDAVDQRFGGLRGLPKHPNGPLLWRLLDEANVPPVREHLLRTLDGMQAGGILDQLGGGFHRCARDERWVVPYFEKLVPVNAALAAVYARAAALFRRPDFADTARAAAAFAQTGLEHDTMVVGADAAYYTWTPARVQEVLEPGLVQAIGLHFNITRDDSPQVLFRALDLEAMAGYADEPIAVMRDRLQQGMARLAQARARRSPPPLVPIDAPAWRAEAIRWLFEAERQGVRVDRTALEAHLAALLNPPLDPARGYARGERHWLEDQAAIAAACLSAAPAWPELADTAAQLASIVLATYANPADGSLTDAPVDGDRGEPSLDVVDHALTAAVPTVVSVLTALHEGADGPSARNRSGFGAAARTIERRHRGATRAALPSKP